MSLPQGLRLQGHTWSREEAGLLRLLFPLAEALPVCLSSLLFVHKNRTRSYRARLGRALSAMGTYVSRGDAVPGLSWHQMGRSACSGMPFHAGCKDGDQMDT